MEFTKFLVDRKGSVAGRFAPRWRGRPRRGNRETALERELAVVAAVTVVCRRCPAFSLGDGPAIYIGARCQGGELMPLAA